MAESAGVIAKWLGRWNRAPEKPGVVGVELSAEGVALAHVTGPTASLELSVCDFRPCAPEDSADALDAMVREYALSGTRCVAVLPSSAYSLRLLDAPEVEPEELGSAAPWLVKDLIDYPLGEAVVDHFQVPDRPGGQSRIHVVTARRTRVDELAKPILAAGLSLQVMDVTELALRNLASRVPDEAQGLALLQLTDRGGMLTMCRGGSLYLARNLETRLSALRDGPPPPPDPMRETDALLLENESDAGEAYDLLVLEIQRSLDYYESQLGPTPISQLAVAPFETPAPGLVPYLEKHLSISVRKLDLGDVLSGPRPAHEARCFVAVGGALHPELSGDEPGAPR